MPNHRALLSISKEHRSNNAYKSCLSRWVNPLLPYQFKIEHLLRAKMGFSDYISLKPYQQLKSISNFNDEFLDATLSRKQSDAKSLQKEKTFQVSILISLFT